jgi:hypothetical protein
MLPLAQPSADYQHWWTLTMVSCCVCTHDKLWQTILANDIPLTTEEIVGTTIFWVVRLQKVHHFTQKSISLGLWRNEWQKKSLHKPANQCFQMWVQLQAVLGQVWFQLISPQNLRTKFYKIWMSVHTSENCHFKQEKQIQQPCCTLAIFTSWSELSWP